MKLAHESQKLCCSDKIAVHATIAFSITFKKNGEIESVLPGFGGGNNWLLVCVSVSAGGRFTPAQTADVIAFTPL